MKFNDSSSFECFKTAFVPKMFESVWNLMTQVPLNVLKLHLSHDSQHVLCWLSLAWFEHGLHSWQQSMTGLDNLKGSLVLGNNNTHIKLYTSIVDFFQNVIVYCGWHVWLQSTMTAWSHQLKVSIIPTRSPSRQIQPKLGLQHETAPFIWLIFIYNQQNSSKLFLQIVHLHNHFIIIIIFNKNQSKLNFD